MDKKITYETQNVWGLVDQKEKEEIFALGEDYKAFLDNSKTERWATREIIRRAEEAGFRNMELLLEAGESLKAGDRVYKVNREKGVALFIVGKEEIIKGLNIVGSHIDAPRLDLKQVPLYETEDLAYFKTHYYGGIKKYQWLAMPLELHGVVIKENGEKIDVRIGEDENDPVMYITDILPHLAKDQMAKKASEFVEGESLNILIGSMPVGEGEEKSVKKNILNILNEKYGLVEEDFLSAELEIVAAGKSRDVGLDRSMIVGYGHDDRVCAYASLKSILEIEEPERTALALFVDKEEIGSTGNTGMSGVFLEDALMDLIYLLEGEHNVYRLKKALVNSQALSADVAACFDPEFASAYEKNNAAQLNRGLALIKYTGARGKSGCNDANPEFVAHVRRVFNEAGVIWQTSELGKTDQGGGGTIAYILAERGMEVIDCGTGVLSMHAPYELISKADLYMTYKGYRAFYQA